METLVNGCYDCPFKDGNLLRCNAPNSPLSGINELADALFNEYVPQACPLIRGPVLIRVNPSAPVR